MELSLWDQIDLYTSRIDNERQLKLNLIPKAAVGRENFQFLGSSCQKDCWVPVLNNKEEEPSRNDEKDSIENHDDISNDKSDEQNLTVQQTKKIKFGCSQCHKIFKTLVSVFC